MICVYYICVYQNLYHDSGDCERGVGVCNNFFFFFFFFFFVGSTYEINVVIPPDEYAEGVNNSAYTNAIAKISLNIALEVGVEFALVHVCIIIWVLQMFL